MGNTNLSLTRFAAFVQVIKTKRKYISEIIAGLLILFFVHSFLSNILLLQGLKNLLILYTYNVNSFAITIIALEGLIALLLFLPKTRMTGFIMVSLFALSALYIVLSKPNHPHHFGGILSEFRSNQQHIVFYAMLIFLSLTGCISMIKKKKIIGDT